MRSLLWKLSISELDILDKEKLKCEKDIDNLYINLKIYAFGTLTNGEIVYATSRFYGQSKFSDVAVAMDSNDTDYLTDNGMCYGKILILAEIILFSKTLPIALIHWYDYYSKRYPIKYECLHLKFVNSYDVIPFNSIVGLVHIVKWFDHQNEFFVNKFYF
ncbi:unnamed protein product [Rhizophagus irregularis]|nr:unnamed protein product [Rhizophagus irregularis]CAB4414654.1 unnamed protein product [Rhizophagus irregularis]